MSATSSVLATDEELLASIGETLPYPWALVCQLPAQLRATGATFVDDQNEPPNRAARRQLLDLAANNEMRAAIERSYGVKLAFRNRRHLALFDPAAVQEYHNFIGTPT